MLHQGGKAPDKPRPRHLSRPIRGGRRNTSTLNSAARVKGADLTRAIYLWWNPFFCAAEKPEKSGFLCKNCAEEFGLDTWSNEKKRPPIKKRRPKGRRGDRFHMLLKSRRGDLKARPTHYECRQALGMAFGWSPKGGFHREFVGVASWCESRSFGVRMQNSLTLFANTPAI